MEVQLVTPKEAGNLYPVMRTDDLQGAMWIPGDSKANPADLCVEERIICDFERMNSDSRSGQFAKRGATYRAF